MEINDLIQDYLGDKDEGLKSLVTFFLNLVMQYESEPQAGAKRYERTKDRIARRNGSKPRTLLTKLGTLTLTKPEFREKSFETEVFAKYSRVEQALINAILESYIQGVSTRKIRHIMKKIGVTGVSAETVSHMGKALDEKVREFFNRPIEQPIENSEKPGLNFYLSTSKEKIWAGLRIISCIRNIQRSSALETS